MSSSCLPPIKQYVSNDGSGKNGEKNSEAETETEVEPK